MALDHLVLCTPDLMRTVADLERWLGVAPVLGGSHPGKGTRNYLLGLSDDSYLEILGPDPEQSGVVSPLPLAEVRLVTWALRVPDIARYAARIPELGPVQAVSRISSQGHTVTGRVTVAPGGHCGPVPFLIDWGDTPHPAAQLPKVALTGFRAVHPFPDQLSEVFRELETNVEVHAGPAAGLIATMQNGARSTVLT